MSSAELQLARERHLEVQFRDLGQQRLTATHGMWVFLATEALFFGALFVSYTMLRLTYPREFQLASHEMSLAYGTANTFVLMTSSLFMALSVRAAKAGRKLRLAAFLGLTAALGAAFLTIKGFEYAFDLRHHSVPGPGLAVPHHADLAPLNLFMYLYWVMTGFHAVHLSVGIGLVGYLIVKTLMGAYTREYHGPVEVVGLYWHFVDVIWLFIYPMLYLAGVGVT
jgi:cytochrome c oxidase subunit 3